jgi:hypothetical protein
MAALRFVSVRTPSTLTLDSTCTGEQKSGRNTRADAINAAVRALMGADSGADMGAAKTDKTPE